MARNRGSVDGDGVGVGVCVSLSRGVFRCQPMPRMIVWRSALAYREWIHGNQ